MPFPLLREPDRVSNGWQVGCPEPGGRLFWCRSIPCRRRYLVPVLECMPGHPEKEAYPLAESKKLTPSVS